jgi:hypothetical protein
MDTSARDSRPAREGEGPEAGAPMSVGALSGGQSTNEDKGNEP